eukprot:COSAG05_NODE_579_length_8556_cov_44.773679_7_plen_97_part_00
MQVAITDGEAPYGDRPYKQLITGMTTEGGGEGGGGGGEGGGGAGGGREGGGGRGGGGGCGSYQFLHAIAVCANQRRCLRVVHIGFHSLQPPRDDSR